jgi:NADH-quinone oxidoreductase subunit N
VINTPSVDWFAISTILVLLGASFIALLGAVLVPNRARRTFATVVSALGFVGGLVTSVWLYVDSADGHRVVADAFYRDRWTALSQVILCGIGLATSLVASEQMALDEHVAEFFSLLLASAAGMAFFVGSANLMVMFLALEWFSIALYVMCAIDYNVEGSLEAGLKYLVSARSDPRRFSSAPHWSTAPPGTSALQRSPPPSARKASITTPCSCSVSR